MIQIHCELEGVAPISFSAPIASTKKTGENHDAFELRTWMERMHVDETGECFIPPQALKNCLADAARYLSETVQGKGKSTYTKHFEAGLMIVDPLMLGVTIDDIVKKNMNERVFVPSDGKRGGGSRVWKTFPVVRQWKVRATIHVVDQVLIDRPEVIKRHLESAGQLIGMGRFRPRNNGHYGRFKVIAFKVAK